MTIIKFITLYHTFLIKKLVDKITLTSVTWFWSDVNRLILLSCYPCLVYIYIYINCAKSLLIVLKYSDCNIFLIYKINKTVCKIIQIKEHV